MMLIYYENWVQFFEYFFPNKTLILQQPKNDGVVSKMKNGSVRCYNNLK